jgi:hypothetical protein
MLKRVEERVLELGDVGRCLLPYLLPEDMSRNISSGDDFHYVSMLASKDRMRAAAYSVLVCDFTTQVVLTRLELLKLLPVGRIVDGVKSAHHSGDIYDAEKNKWRTNLKSHPGATNKVNVYFSEIMMELKRKDRMCWEQIVGEQWRLSGLYDDQCSALVLYQQAIVGEFGHLSLDIATALLHDPITAKAFSTVIKSLGLNGTSYGSMLCESNALQGRAVGSVDMDKEVMYRLDELRVADKVVSFSNEALRVAVRKVISAELSRDVHFPAVEEYWSKRWLWCVNGAHGNALGRLRKEYKTNFRKRMHRRVFAENLEHEPITRWDGSTFFTMSEKLEHGKTRAIFGGDSVSYFCFDHLLRVVEKNWRGRRVVLDPGRGGSVGMVERVEKLKGAWHVMLDYDDFNSQHTLDAQAIVIEELVGLSGYDFDLGYKLVDSIYNQFVVIDGKPTKLFGTLMSGHRATSIINSVLNLAYIMCAAPEIETMRSIHVGDDIYIKTDTASEAASILSKVSKSGVRMNPLKQSVGTHTAEFLRHASGRSGSYGYVTRSISSVVSGNWESEMRLNAEEFVNSVLQSSWTIMNRSRTECASLMARSMNRVTGIGLSLCRAALIGRASINGSPVRAQGWVVPTVRLKVGRVLEGRGRLGDEVKALGGKDYATSAYQRLHISPVEVMAVKQTGIDLNETMLESSYKKTLIDRNTEPSMLATVSYTGDVWRPVSGEDFMKVRSEREVRGVLVQYPILQLLRDRLTVSDVRKLLRLVGLTCTQGWDVMTFAFGPSERHRVWVVGSIPYADLRSLCMDRERCVYTIRQRYF